jgi:hypothetical protein
VRDGVKVHSLGSREKERKPIIFTSPSNDIRSNDIQCNNYSIHIQETPTTTCIPVKNLEMEKEKDK